MFAALAETIRTCRLETSLFDDLLSAFRQDVLVSRYETWDDVLDYCRRSADPVGRLVLRVGGYRDPDLDVLSDRVCTALQLTNFWQDLARDWDRGRLYVPLEVVRGAGADLSDLDCGRIGPAWHAALAQCAARTRALFFGGRSIADAVRGRLRWELRATWAGGMRILDRLEARGFDAFTARPTLGLADGPAVVWQLLRWKRP